MEKLEQLDVVSWQSRTQGDPSATHEAASLVLYEVNKEKKSYRDGKENHFMYDTLKQLITFCYGKMGYI